MENDFFREGFSAMKEAIFFLFALWLGFFPYVRFLLVFPRNELLYYAETFSVELYWSYILVGVQLCKNSTRHSASSIKRK